MIFRRVKCLEYLGGDASADGRPETEHLLNHAMSIGNNAHHTTLAGLSTLQGSNCYTPYSHHVNK